jgi:ATP-dependent Clp protease ATP-binding subunit ClpX
MKNVVPDDLVKYGMIPEFVGRFPSVVTLDNLEFGDMRRILTEIKHNYVDQYRWLFEQDGIDLTFDQGALDAIIERAMASGTGARALHSEIERALMPHMFDIREYRKQSIDSLQVTKDMVNKPHTL